MRALRCAPVVLAVSLALPQAATAQSFDDVTDSDFAIDLYTGPVLGSTRIIGMGGAAVGMAEGAAGQPFNPAAPAVRPSNSHDKWDWDINFDWLNPEIGKDFDNNGVAADERTVDATAVFLVGGVVNYNKWAFGLNGSIQTFDVVRTRTDMDEEITETFRSKFEVIQLSVARLFLDDQVAVGLGVIAGNYSLSKLDPEATLIELNGGALEIGAEWLPRNRNFRVGFRASPPARTTTTTPTDCEEPIEGEPIMCEGFIIPERVEKVLLLAADVVVTGKISDGYGMEQYVLASQLQPSGRTVAVSYRMGADYACT